MKHIAILGSTGSIGTQTLEVVRRNPALLKVVALGCDTNIELMEKQAREFLPLCVAVCDERAAETLRVRLLDTPVRVLGGMDGIIEMCTLPEADVIVTACVGMIGLRPTIAAICAGKDIALANKETLVTAGHLIIPLAKEKKVRILPVDSEHSAIFQALQGRADSGIKKILLTASGGPFRHMDASELEQVTVDQALAHPTWTMGPKITIDSASMVNKGLEVIEAKWLFGVNVDQIEVVIQPQSVIHSMVEYEDGSVIAQLGPTDMLVPIQYALTYPTHLPSAVKPLDFRTLKKLDFDVPRNDVFRGIPLAIEAAEAGGSMPCVFNAANEWANAHFRSGRIRFPEIYEIIEGAMAAHTVIKHPDVETILSVEKEVNRYCEAHFA